MLSRRTYFWNPHAHVPAWSLPPEASHDAASLTRALIHAQLNSATWERLMARCPPRSVAIDARQVLFRELPRDPDAERRRQPGERPAGGGGSSNQPVASPRRAYSSWSGRTSPERSFFIVYSDCAWARPRRMHYAPAPVTA